MTNSDQSASPARDDIGALASGIKQAKSGVHQTIDKLAESAGPAVERLASGAHHAVDGVASAATQASESLSTKGLQIKDAQTHFVESSREYIRAHPVAALGIAVAAGFLISRLLSKR